MNIVLLSFIMVIGLLVFVVESVRREMLDTNYSLIWLFTCVILGILSSSSYFINKIASILHVDYAPSILFLFGFLFVIIMLFDLTRRISKMNRKLTSLAQENAILKKHLEEKEDKSK